MFPGTLPFQPELNGSSLRIEFLLNQVHCQIWSLCLDQRGGCMQNGATVAALCDSPASTFHADFRRRGRLATGFPRQARMSLFGPCFHILFCPVVCGFFPKNDAAGSKELDSQRTRLLLWCGVRFCAFFIRQRKL